MSLLYHTYVYLEFLILACTIYILTPKVLKPNDAEQKVERTNKVCYTKNKESVMRMNEKMTNYFNIMAQIIRVIIESDKYNEKNFLSILYDYDSKEYRELRFCVPVLFQINGEKVIPANLRLRDMNTQFFSVLESIEKRKEIYELMLLLYYMDRAIVECYKRWYCYEDDEMVIESLNSNKSTTNISLIKRTKCKWGLSQIGSGLDGLLYHFFYINNKEIPNFVVKNHILSPEVLRGIGKNKLKMALSPITKDKVVEFSEPYERRNDVTGAKQKYFRVEKVIDEESVYEQVLGKIYMAGENDVDIMVFPEMLGTESMLTKIQDELTEKNTKQVPDLIIFPSIWDKTENDLENRNRSCVILNGRTVLFEQYKYADYKNFIKDIPVYEDINRNKGKNIIHMIHIEGIGRICIVICVDYLDENNRKNIMNHLFPTLVCVPSFSTGSVQFLLLAEKYLNKGCNWIWCNTCSAAHETIKKENFKVVGAITKWDKDWNLKEEGLKNFFPGKFKCEKLTCDGCIYMEEISLKIVEKK